MTPAEIATQEQRRIDSATFVRTRIGANIKKIRTERGINQAYLASLMRAYVAGWTQPVVSRVELGHRELRAVELVALGQVLGVDICRFVASGEGVS